MITIYWAFAMCQELRDIMYIYKFMCPNNWERDTTDIISFLQMKKLRHTERLSYLPEVLGANGKARIQRQGLMPIETLCHLLHEWAQ